MTARRAKRKFRRNVPTRHYKPRKAHVYFAVPVHPDLYRDFFRRNLDKICWTLNEKFYPVPPYHYRDNPNSKYKSTHLLMKHKRDLQNQLRNTDESTMVLNALDQITTVLVYRGLGIEHKLPLGEFGYLVPERDDGCE